MANPNGPVLTPEQMAVWVQRVGGSPAEASFLSRIGYRESRGRVKINNAGLNKNGTTDWGWPQVNDVWRKDPVVGPLFKSGALLTPRGGAVAALHILRTQGPAAWSTYNPTVDAKYLTGAPDSHGGSLPAPSAPGASGTRTRTIPGVDNSGLRRDLIAQFVLQGGPSNDNALIGLASGLPGLKDTPARTVTVKAPSSTATATGSSGASTAPPPTSAKGVATFDGKPVAAWIAPILKYARSKGWSGTVSSGYRTDAQQTAIYKSGVRPAAVPKSMGGSGSNHESSVYPGGAVDVTNASQLSQILQNSPYAQRLIWAGSKDPVHFSHPHGGGY